MPISKRESDTFRLRFTRKIQGCSRWRNARNKCWKDFRNSNESDITRNEETNTQKSNGESAGFRGLPWRIVTSGLAKWKKVLFGHNGWCQAFWLSSVLLISHFIWLATKWGPTTLRSAQWRCLCKRWPLHYAHSLTGQRTERVHEIRRVLSCQAVHSTQCAIVSHLVNIWRVFGKKIRAKMVLCWVGNVPFSVEEWLVYSGNVDDLKAKASFEESVPSFCIIYHRS